MKHRATVEVVVRVEVEIDARNELGARVLAARFIEHALAANEKLAAGLKPKVGRTRLVKFEAP